MQTDWKEPALPSDAAPVAEHGASPKQSADETAPAPRRLDLAGGIFALFQSDNEASFTARYALVAVWLLVGLLFAVLVGGSFLSNGTYSAVFGSQQPLVFLATASVVVLAVGEFDLSVASVLGLSATVLSVLVVNHGWDPLTAAIAAVAVAAVAGMVNAFVIVVMGIDAIVVTLGMATLLAGIASKVSNNIAIAGLSNSFANVSNTQVLGLPITFFYGLALIAVVAYIMRFTPLGRHMTFVGENREVSRLAGVRVRRMRMGAYVMSAVICGVGGVLLAASIGGYDSSTSSQYLLPALSATFLGTAAIRPGRFNALGTFVAIYFLATGIVGLQLLGASEWISDVFYGTALILAVVVATITRRRTLTV